jgi:hypothetical protein
MALRVPPLVYRSLWIGVAVFAALSLLGAAMMLGATAFPATFAESGFRVIENNWIQSLAIALGSLAVVILALRRLLNPLKSPNPATFD